MTQFIHIFLEIGGWLILIGLALAGFGAFCYGRGRAVEQHRIAKLIERGII